MKGEPARPNDRAEIRVIMKPGYFRKRLTIEAIMRREDGKRFRRMLDAAYKKSGCKTRFRRIK